MARNKDAFYFPHDCNARNDPKILALRSVYGVEGYGVYFMILEILREQSDYKLPINEYTFSVLSMQIKISQKKIKKILEDCCKNFLDGEKPLLINDGKYIYSESLVKRMEKREDVAEARRRAALKRWGEEDANALQSDARKGNKGNKGNKGDKGDDTTTTARARACGGDASLSGVDTLLWALRQLHDDTDYEPIKDGLAQLISDSSFREVQDAVAIAKENGHAGQFGYIRGIVRRRRQESGGNEPEPYLSIPNLTKPHCAKVLENIAASEVRDPPMTNEDGTDDRGNCL